MIGWLRNVPAWVWWVVASVVGGAVLAWATGSLGAAGTVVAVGGAAAASEGARERARRATAEAESVKLRPLPPRAERPTVDPGQWDSGPAGRD